MLLKLNSLKFAHLVCSAIIEVHKFNNKGSSKMKKILPGVLLRSQASEFGDKVYYVDRGRRYWIRDGKWLSQYGFEWAVDVIDVEPAILYSFLNGGMAPLRTFSDLGASHLTSIDLREIAACNLYGTGMEFGAGASPFPVPLHCNVLYADAFSYQALREGMYPGQTAHDLIRPDYVTDIKTLNGVSDASLDFIVACHVIEHTNNPIGAINSCYRALKPGGSLVLVVPDMNKTFDKNRELTTLAHLIEDNHNPSPDRDCRHYEEFYSKAFELPAGSNLLEYAAQKQAEGGDLHYHTWTYESFGELVEACAASTPWSVSFSHPTLQGPENIEFYFVLKK